MTETKNISTRLADLPDYELVQSGTGACAGCPSPMGLRSVGKALGPNAIMVMTPSCAVASLGMLPKSCGDVPVFNVCFAAAGASAAGISGALDAQLAKGILAGPKPVVFNWVGDGGTYDIGFQGISAAAERNDDFIHFCYNNEAYSNTGVQRSGATPRYAATTTTPAGKEESKKNLPLLMLEHRPAYVATASIAYPRDFYRKVARAREIKGFRYIELHAPCGPGWKFPASETVAIGRLAVKTGAWALWEAAAGELELNTPTLQLAEGKMKREPLEEYLRSQGRFAGLMKRRDREAAVAEMALTIEKELAGLLARSRIV
jgi:pyruvate ferredoxin oxidoreductase beta subunit